MVITIAFRSVSVTRVRKVKMKMVMINLLDFIIEISSGINKYIGIYT